MSVLIKAFFGKPVFSEPYDEDLNNIFSSLDTPSEIGAVNLEEKYQAVPVMLKGDA